MDVTFVRQFHVLSLKNDVKTTSKRRKNQVLITFSIRRKRRLYYVVFLRLKGVYLHRCKSSYGRHIHTSVSRLIFEKLRENDV